MDETCPSCEEPVIDKYPPCPLQCMTANCKSYMKTPYVDVNVKPVIWIIGGPGVGKGTQAQKVTQKYGLTLINAGELLRAEVIRDTNRSMCVRNIMKRGGLVPTDIVMDLIKAAFRELEPGAKGFVIDGYPRNKEQALAFEKVICTPSAIIYIDLKPETMVRRLLKRAAESDRMDDSEDCIQTRIQQFTKTKDEFVDHFEDRVKIISGDLTPDDLFREIQKIVDTIPTIKKAAGEASGSPRPASPPAKPASPPPTPATATSKPAK